MCCDVDLCVPWDVCHITVRQTQVSGKITIGGTQLSNGWDVDYWGPWDVCRIIDGWHIDERHILHRHVCLCVYEYLNHQPYDNKESKWSLLRAQQAWVSCAPQGLMRLTRLRADSRGTPTARGRQCRMSKKDKRRVRRGNGEQKHTEHTNQSE